MEKISGILPAGRRFKNIDVSRAQPVRPGAPTFGRPVGRSSQVDVAAANRLSAGPVVDRLSISEDAKLQANDLLPMRETEVMSARPSEEMAVYSAPKPVVASSVEEMTTKFFSPQKSAAPQQDIKFDEAPVSVEPQKDFSRQNPYSSSEQIL